MTSQDAKQARLEIGNGGEPELFTPVAGLQSISLQIENELLNASHAASGPWQQSLSQAGKQHLTLSASGRFNNSAAETCLQQLAFSKEAGSFRCHLAHGSIITGSFLIQRYERLAGMQEAEEFRVTLSSSGAVNYSSS